MLSWSMRRSVYKMGILYTILKKNFWKIKNHESSEYETTKRHLEYSLFCSYKKNDSNKDNLIISYSRSCVPLWWAAWFFYYLAKQ